MKGKTKMKNTWKKIVAMASALAVAFTAVVATDVTTAKAAADDYDILYESTSVETATAGTEVKVPFSVSKSGAIDFLIYTTQPVGVSLALYTSSGSLADYSNNPLRIESTNSNYWYVDAEGAICDDAWDSLPAGDYFYGITFDTDTAYMLVIAQEKAAAKISQSKATITVGFTKKLSVTGAKVKKWSSSKKTVATVDKKGKVTAKKAGKATISAKCEGGKTVKCVVTVKANKYSDTKPTVSDITRGSCILHAYSASFDSKGNLVIKARFVNNYYYKVVALNNVKITVKNSSGKTVGTYKTKKKSVSVAPASTKDLSFTISKSSLKQKKVDLRNADIVCDGSYTYVY